MKRLSVNEFWECVTCILKVGMTGQYPIGWRGVLQHIMLQTQAGRYNIYIYISQWGSLIDWMPLENADKQ